MTRTFRFFVVPLLAMLSAVGLFGAGDSYEWKNVQIGGGGFVSAIVTSKSTPDLVYARTDVGGAYRWSEEDSSWVALHDWVSAGEIGFLGVESIAIDESNPDRVYMLVGISYFNNGRTAILRSDDRGETFSIVDVSSQFRAHGNGMGRQNGERLQVDPANGDILYCGTRQSGLFKSMDAGLTWSHLDGLSVTSTPNANGVCFVLLDPDSAEDQASQSLFIGVSRTGENLYHSEDGGESFSPVAGGPSGLMPQRAVLASDGSLYLTYGDGAGPHGATGEPMESGGVWKYDTALGTWTNVTPSGFTRAFGGLSVDPNDPDRLVVSTINTWMYQDNSYGDRILLSENGGASWVDVVERGFDMDPNGVTWIEGQSIHWAGSLEFDPFDTSRVWVTSGNGVYRTDDIDATQNVWKFTVRGLEETVPLGFVSVKDGPLISVIGDYDGFLHADPSQYAPIHSPGIGTTTGIAVAGQDADVVLRVGDSMLYSEDGGQSWTETLSMNGEKGLVGLSADGAVFLHCPENSSTTYRSTDKGATWSAATGVAVRDARPVGDAVDSDAFYVYGNGVLYVSSDGGQSFSAAANLPSNGSGLLAVAPDQSGDLWVALNGSGLMRSTDAGVSFTAFQDVSYCEAVGLGKAADGASYHAVYIWGTIDGTRGIYRSIDEGESWIRVNDDAHEFGGPGNGHFVVGDMNEFGRVYMSTAGRGIVYGEIVGDSVPYDVWLDLYFSAEQQVDEQVVGAVVDFDHDGIPNLLEWALLTDPTVPDLISDTVFEYTGQIPSLRIVSQERLSSRELRVEISVDLVNWVPVLDAFDQVSREISPEESTQAVRYELKATGDEAARFFVRLLVVDEG